jgi:hypothetical protein
MNKFNKLLFSALSLFALTVMTSCDGNGITIEAAVANQRVMDAMEQMTTTEIESFEIDITGTWIIPERLLMPMMSSSLNAISKPLAKFTSRPMTSLAKMPSAASPLQLPFWLSKMTRL